MNKYKYFDIVTEVGAFQVKAPASKVTENYASRVALHWLKMQHNVAANELKSIRGL